MLPITMGVDVLFDLSGFKKVLVEVFDNPAYWWELLLLLAYWAVDAFIFALVFHFVLRRFIAPHQNIQTD
jgi:hypothetical protein